MVDSGAAGDHKPAGNEIPLPSNLGERIRAARLTRGMTLADVASGDFSPSFLSLVEQGKSGLSLRSLELIAQRLELPVSYFFEAEPGALEVAELALDRAETDLSNEEPEACLNRLNGLTPPEPLRARESWLRGRALIATGHMQAGLSALQDALSVAEKREQRDLIPRIRYGIVQALLTVRSYDEAVVVARRALDEVLVEPVNPVIAGRLMLALGHILFIQEKTDEALHHYARAQEMFEGVPDLAALGTLHAGLSEASERIGDMRAATRYARSSATLLGVNSDVRFITYEHCTLALHYLRLGDLPRARSAATKALLRAQLLGARDLEARARSVLAMILLHGGDLTPAAENAVLARDLAQGDHDLARIDAWVTLAEIAERTDATAEADELYARALASCRDRGRHSRYAEICVAYSQLLQTRGETDRALQVALMGAQAQSR